MKAACMKKSWLLVLCCLLSKVFAEGSSDFYEIPVCITKPKAQETIDINPFDLKTVCLPKPCPELDDYYLGEDPFVMFVSGEEGTFNNLRRSRPKDNCKDGDWEKECLYSSPVACDWCVCEERRRIFLVVVDPTDPGLAYPIALLPFYMIKDEIYAPYGDFPSRKQFLGSDEEALTKEKRKIESLPLNRPLSLDEFELLLKEYMGKRNILPFCDGVKERCVRLFF